MMSLPRSVSAPADCLMEPTAFAQAARFLRGGGEAAVLAVFHHRIDDPIDFGVSADGRVRLVHHYDLEEFVGAVLAYPIRVEHAQRSALSTGAFLRDRLKRPFILQLIHTVASRLAVHLSLWHRALAAPTTNAHAVDDVSLLRAVPQTTRLFRSSGARTAHKVRQLSVLPTTQTDKKAHHIALLLSVHFLHVLVSTHLRNNC